MMLEPSKTGRFNYSKIMEGIRSPKMDVLATAIVEQFSVVVAMQQTTIKHDTTHLIGVGYVDLRQERPCADLGYDVGCIIDGRVTHRAQSRVNAGVYTSCGGRISPGLDTTRSVVLVKRQTGSHE